MCPPIVFKSPEEMVYPVVFETSEDLSAYTAWAIREYFKFKQRLSRQKRKIVDNKQHTLPSDESQKKETP